MGLNWPDIRYWNLRDRLGGTMSQIVAAVLVGIVAALVVAWLAVQVLA